jgi:uncharacterized protein (TIGR02270 family)
MIDRILSQHVEDASVLAALRVTQVAAPHVNLKHLALLDERIAAHVDGIVVAGESGWQFCEQALAMASVGTAFTATAAVIHARHPERLDRMFALAEAVPEARAGFLSAFGWVSSEQLRTVGGNLLASDNAFRRYTGIAACSMHRVDPGLALTRAIGSSDRACRARALRTAGELGRRDLLSNCIAAIRDLDADCRLWGAWSAVLLGERERALEILMTACGTPGAHTQRALDLVLLTLEPRAACTFLGMIAPEAWRTRRVLRGLGLVGDSAHVPWLIEQMTDVHLARVAGEAFSLITGADLEALDLERSPPADIDFGPNDDPQDDNIHMDPDSDLPWPDAIKVHEWWQTNQYRFTSGERLLLGHPVTRESCMKVLSDGYQRQRRIAALHIALQNPGEALFEWRAPAWRQQRRLSASKLN